MDGRKVKKSRDADIQEFDAKWQDYRLVADFKGLDGNKIERSFEVLEGNQQLLGDDSPYDGPKPARGVFAVRL